jgi:hypothetical protein
MQPLQQTFQKKEWGAKRKRDTGDTLSKMLHIIKHET